MRKAVFLDRDGVVNVLVRDPESGQWESPLCATEVEILPGVAQAITKIRDEGYVVFLVTNQPSAAKGQTSVEALIEVQEAVVKSLMKAGAQPDDWAVCLHHPDGVVSKLALVCACRKPKAGMLRDLARRWRVDLAASWLVGDSDVDMIAGNRAGCRTILVEHGRSAHRRGGSVPSDFSARDCLEAADIIALEGA